MTNITELAQSLKRRATSANEFGESLYVKGADVIALVEALERKEEQRANWFQMAQKLGKTWMRQRSASRNSSLICLNAQTASTMVLPTTT